MKLLWTALVCGFIFGIGLCISGMTQPELVLAFLDLSDNWDPSLAFVMVGAIAVNATLFRWSMGRSAPLLAEVFHLPTRTDLDSRLVVGSGLFGVGWGLAGYCPGPALLSGATLSVDGLVFMAAFTVGVVLQAQMPPAEATTQPQPG